MAVTARVTREEKGPVKEPHSFHHDGYDINLVRDKRSQGEKSIKKSSYTYCNQRLERVSLFQKVKSFYFMATENFKIVAVSRNYIA